MKKNKTPENEIPKEKKRVPSGRAQHPLEYYIERLGDAKADEFSKVLKSMTKFDDEDVLKAVSTFLESASTIDAFRNSHDVFVNYGEKSLAILDAMYSKPSINFETRECVIFSLYAIGAKDDARQKLLALYLALKDDDNYNLQLIVDLFELDLLKEGVNAATYHMNKSEEHGSELLSVLFDFFEEHLEIESWLRGQSDVNSQNLVRILDELSAPLNDVSVSRDVIEFFKIEDFLIEGYNENTIPEIVFSYHLSNGIANYITSYKAEYDIDFLEYTKIRGFVFSIIKPVIQMIKNYAGPVLSDLDADASALFSKDGHKSQYEKLFYFFWEDMKLIYGVDNVKPANIDYFAWKMLCMVYSSLREFITQNGGIPPAENSEDENFTHFSFDVAEEITNNVEEYISYSEGNVFTPNEETMRLFEGLINRPETKK